MTQPQQRDPRQPFGQPGSRDPRQPFGGPDRASGAPQQFQPQEFEPPRDRRPLWITLATLFLVALLAAIAIRMGTRPSPEPQTAPAPAGASTGSQESTEAAQQPEPTSTGSTPGTGERSSIPFVNDNDDTAGNFEVVDHRWTQQGLLLTLRVTLDKGSQRLGFFALDDQTASQYDPSPAGPNRLDGQMITAGQTLTGQVLFQKERGSTTVFLSATGGRQVAALKVAG